MKIVKYSFWILWKIWFYLLVLVVTLVLSPFLLVAILSEKTYAYFFLVARFWAKAIFFGIGFRYKPIRHQKIQKGKSYMFIANHTSVMDVMLLFILVKDNPFVYVGKKELAKIPIFGYFYKRTCILVDRNNSKSKFNVFKSAQARLDKGLSICIFPEGGVSDDPLVFLDSFKDGAFRLAIDCQIPIVPISIGYLKDLFPFKFFAGYPGMVPVVVHPFLETIGKTQQDRRKLKESARNVISSQILTWEKCKNDSNNSLAEIRNDLNG